MSERVIDVVIIGAGPAGLQAAIHASRKKADTVVVGRPERSSIYKAHVENYFGVAGVVEGGELVAIGVEQIKRFGAELIEEDVLGVSQEGETFQVVIESGRTLSARALVIATGTSRKKLKVKGEKELAGKGVSYCVDCDANFCRNAKVAVVGEGSAAVDGALTLTKFASEVHLVGRSFEVSAALQEKLGQSQVVVHQGAWPTEIKGENAVTGLLLDNGEELAVDGVFIELGAKGIMELATNLGVLLDPENFSFIQVNRRQETNIPGVFAAGDITGPPWQMAKAVGEGCVAGLEAATFAGRRKRQE